MFNQSVYALEILPEQLSIRNPGGGITSFTITLKNDTPSTEVISRVAYSCGCTSVKLDGNDINLFLLVPHASAEAIVTYNGLGKPTNDSGSVAFILEAKESESPQFNFNVDNSRLIDVLPSRFICTVASSGEVLDFTNNINVHWDSSITSEPIYLTSLVEAISLTTGTLPNGIKNTLLYEFCVDNTADLSSSTRGLVLMSGNAEVDSIPVIVNTVEDIKIVPEILSFGHVNKEKDYIRRCSVFFRGQMPSVNFITKAKVHGSKVSGHAELVQSDGIYSLIIKLRFLKDGVLDHYPIVLDFDGFAMQLRVSGIVKAE